jgi:hypothetical protein
MSFRFVTFAGTLVSSLNLINQVFLRIFAAASPVFSASGCLILAREGTDARLLAG